MNCSDVRDEADRDTEVIINQKRVILRLLRIQLRVHNHILTFESVGKWKMEIGIVYNMCELIHPY